MDGEKEREKLSKRVGGRGEQKGRAGKFACDLFGIA